MAEIKHRARALKVEHIPLGTFADVLAFVGGCRFTDCRHATEPGCAVRAAVADGWLPADRLPAFQTLQREVAACRRRPEAARW